MACAHTRCCRVIPRRATHTKSNAVATPYGLTMTDHPYMHAAVIPNAAMALNSVESGNIWSGSHADRTCRAAAFSGNRATRRCRLRDQMVTGG